MRVWGGGGWGGKGVGKAKENKAYSLNGRLLQSSVHPPTHPPTHPLTLERPDWLANHLGGPGQSLEVDLLLGHRLGTEGLLFGCLNKWVGGWVGWVEEIEAVRLRCCDGGEGWVSGWGGGDGDAAYLERRAKDTGSLARVLFWLWCVVCVSVGRKEEGKDGWMHVGCGWVGGWRKRLTWRYVSPAMRQ